VFARERGNLAAIAARGHGAPPAAMRARCVVEKKAAPRVGAQANGGSRSFDDNIRGGTDDGGEQPVETVFAGDVLDAPELILLQQLIVAFCYAEEGVHRFDPLTGDSFLPDHGREYAMQRLSKAVGFFEKSVGGLGVALGQEQQSGAPLRRDDARSLEECNKFFPMKLSRRRGSVDEVEGQASAEESVDLSMVRRGHDGDNRLWTSRRLSYAYLGVMDHFFETFGELGTLIR
jgi:hypothetical protein